MTSLRVTTDNFRCIPNCNKAALTKDVGPTQIPDLLGTDKRARVLAVHSMRSTICTSCSKGEPRTDGRSQVQIAAIAHNYANGRACSSLIVVASSLTR